MKRFMLLILLGLLMLPAAAQDATEVPEEDEVVYDPELCFAAAESNDTMVALEAKEGPFVIAVSNS